MSLRWSYTTRGGVSDYKHSIPDGILIDFAGPLSIDTESLEGSYLSGDQQSFGENVFISRTRKLHLSETPEE